MDNRTGEVLNEKCHRFEQLYHGSVNGKQYCLGTNVAKEYMCPLISNGRIEEMPLHPWFGKQSGGDMRGVAVFGFILRFQIASCPARSSYS